MQTVFFPVLLMAAIAAYIGIRNLFLFFLKKNHTVSLYFSLLCFSIAVYDIFGFFMYTALNPASSMVWARWQLLAGISNAMMIAFFIFSLLKKPLTTIAKVFISLFGLFFLITLVLPAQIMFMVKENSLKRIPLFDMMFEYYEVPFSPIMLAVFFLFILGIGYVCYILVKSINRDNKKDIIPMLAGFSIFFISCLCDFSATFGLIKFIYTTEYAFISIALCMDYSLMRQLSTLYHNQEALQIKLEKEVEEQTREIRNLVHKLEKQNERLSELVERDSLTELYNHASFFKHLHSFLNASRRHAFPMSVLIIDIDDFKAINDTCGHCFGDAVLKSIALVLKNTSREYDEKARHVLNRGSSSPQELGVRNYDVISRYGGDEFTLLLLFCSEKESTIVANRLQEKITKLRFQEPENLSVTCSIGGAYLQADTVCHSAEDLFKAADSALYTAKRSGKNKTVIIPFQQELKIGI